MSCKPKARGDVNGVCRLTKIKGRVVAVSNVLLSSMVGRLRSVTCRGSGNSGNSLKVRKIAVIFRFELHLEAATKRLIVIYSHGRCAVKRRVQNKTIRLKFNVHQPMPNPIGSCKAHLFNSLRSRGIYNLFVDALLWNIQGWYRYLVVAACKHRFYIVGTAFLERANQSVHKPVLAVASRWYGYETILRINNTYILPWIPLCIDRCFESVAERIE